MGDFFMSWVKSWQDWLEFDNFHGPDGGSLLNREITDAFLGVAMIQTQPSWTDNPLNMVNYYGFGRMAWDPMLTTERVYQEWIAMTFGSSLASSVQEVVKQIFTTSETAADNMCMYHGYRGVWYQFLGPLGDQHFRSPTSVKQIMDKSGAGTTSDRAKELLDMYPPGVRAIYKNHSDPRTERGLLEFGVFEWNTKLANGRTLIEDAALRPYEGASKAADILSRWTSEELRKAVETACPGNFWNTTATQLDIFSSLGSSMAALIHKALAKLHKIPPAPSPTPGPRAPAPSPVPSPLAPSPLAEFVRHETSYWGTSGTKATRAYDKSGKDSAKECADRCLGDDECTFFDYKVQKKQCRYYHGIPQLVSSTDAFDAFEKKELFQWLI